jgi:hypothetical protein
MIRHLAESIELSRARITVWRIDLAALNSILLTLRR